MRTTIILIALAFVVAIFACSDEQITNFSKERLVELQNDENWEEITDIDTVLFLSTFEDVYLGDGTFCINHDKVEYGVFLRNMQDLEYIFDGEPLLSSDLDYTCSDSLTKFIADSRIDFEEHDYFINYIKSGPVNLKRYIFINKQDKVIQYIVEIPNKPIIREAILHHWLEMIRIPKVSTGYTVEIDTLLNDSI